MLDYMLNLNDMQDAVHAFADMEARKNGCLNPEKVNEWISLYSYYLARKSSRPNVDGLLICGEAALLKVIIYYSYAAGFQLFGNCRASTKDETIQSILEGVHNILGHVQSVTHDSLFPSIRELFYNEDGKSLAPVQKKKKIMLAEHFRTLDALDRNTINQIVFLTGFDLQNCGRSFVLDLAEGKIK